MTRCSVCGGSALRPLLLGEHRLQRCTGCGTVTSAEYDDPDIAYDDRYHTGESGRFIDTDQPQFREYLEQCNRDRLALLRSVRLPPGRLLDVGCGRGELLAAAAADGWAVTGVEPVAAAAEAARDRHGIDVRTGRLGDVDLPGGGFDVVCAFHVVEHVPDAVAFLVQLRDLVRPGGIVLVEVPNWRSASRRRFGGRWPHLHPGDHITHFTSSTLRRALLRAGLRPVALRSPSYTNPPQLLGQAAADLCLGRWARALRPFSRPAVGGFAPTRVGWRLIHTIDGGYSVLRVGVVLLVAARRPG